MEEDKRYKEAKERVEEIKSFYVHLIIYLLVNLVLFIINILTSPGSLWFYWPLFGWGIGLFFHGFSVFGTRRIFGKDWEERKIKEIMEEDKVKEE